MSQTHIKTFFLWLLLYLIIVTSTVTINTYTYLYMYCIFHFYSTLILFWGIKNLDRDRKRILFNPTQPIYGLNLQTQKCTFSTYQLSKAVLVLVSDNTHTRGGLILCIKGGNRVYEIEIGEGFLFPYTYLGVYSRIKIFVCHLLFFIKIEGTIIICKMYTIAYILFSLCSCI